MVRLLIFDLLITPLLMAVWALLLHARDIAGVITLAAVLSLVRMLAWLGHMHAQLAPVRAWFERERGDDAQLLAAEAALQQLPTRCSSIYALSWSACLVLATGIGHFVLPELLTIGRGELILVLMLLLCEQWALALIVYPLLKLDADPLRVELLAAIRERGLAPELRARSLTARLRSQGLLMVLTPMMATSIIAWRLELEAVRSATMLDAIAQVDARARALREGQLPTAEDAILPAASEHARAEVDIRRDIVRASARLDDERWDGRWLVIEQPVPLGRGSFWLALALLTACTASWGFYAITGFARSMTRPIERLRRAIHRVVDVGDVSEIAALPVLDADELGELIEDLNRLITTQRELAAAAATLARGDLTVAFTGHGQLVGSLRSMVEQLHEIISRIHASARHLAMTSSEMLAAVREQELAAEQHTTHMGELRRLMASLARASVHNHAAVDGVLDNAEATLATTDDMVAEINSLEARTRGIGELLEVIREVADRSDILALNGSLEATRAGEAGRGFALVAAEMRRLAERVTGTVVNVRALVADISAASASTVAATERSRGLAHSTTTAARTIAEASQRQREDTESVSQGIGEIADLISRSSVATTQTRAAAQQLRQQAADLDDLIGAFELRRDGGGRVDGV